MPGEPGGAGHGHDRGPTPAAPGYPRWRRLLAAGFFALLAWLLWRAGRTLDWAAVGAAVRAQAPGALAVAALPALASHALYATFDLIGRHETGHPLPRSRVMAVGHVSYAFNLNFGSLVGGIALRYRLYRRLGLDLPTITRVLAFSLATNWFGWAVLAGGVFLLRPLPLPEAWPLGGQALPAVGAVLLVAAVGYVAGVLAFGHRRWRWRGHLVELPDRRVLPWQLAVSAASWALIALTVWWLLGRRVDYPSVLAVMLLAAIAGVLTHVPAGLGVLEAVAVALLAHRLPAAEIIAALLAYRTLYYLLPLLPAAVCFAVLESRSRRGGPLPAGTRLAGRSSPPTEEPR